MTTYDSRENVAELRRDALAILLVIAAGSWLIIFVVSLIYFDVTEIATPLPPLIVLISVILGSSLLRHQERIEAAAWLLISGLIAAPALFIDLQGPNAAGYFMLLIPVMVTSLLIGEGSEFRVAGVVIVITVGVTAALQPDLSLRSISHILDAVIVPGGVCLIIAFIGYLNTRNIYAMTRWALDNQDKYSRRARTLYEQYEQLSHTLRRLEYANHRFALLNAELTDARPTAATSILIVDTDPQALVGYQRLFSGVFPAQTIHTAASGVQVVEVLAQTTPGMVILNLHMAEVDGFAALDAIRSNPTTQNVPVLTLSGRILSADDVIRLANAHVAFQNNAPLAVPFADPPRGPFDPDDLLPSQTSTLVRQAIAYIHDNYAQRMSRLDIARFVGVSERHMTRLFNQEIGLPPGEYLTRYRIQRAKRLLRTTSEGIATIASQVGFDDPAHFSRTFRKETGLSPSDFRVAGK